MQAQFREEERNIEWQLASVVSPALDPSKKTAQIFFYPPSSSENLFSARYFVGRKGQVERRVFML